MSEDRLLFLLQHVKTAHESAASLTVQHVGHPERGSTSKTYKPIYPVVQVRRYFPAPLWLSFYLSLCLFVFNIQNFKVFRSAIAQNKNQEVTLGSLVIFDHNIL